MAEDKTTILFLAANPADTSPLRLDKEIKAIDQALRLSDFGRNFDIEQAWAVSVPDLQGLLLRYKPNIVHFSGHGASSGVIILEASERGDLDTSRELDVLSNAFRSGMQVGHVSARALSRTFEILKDNIRCVLLNSCYSEDQAEAIAEHIDCVIGMNTAISDNAAIEFAASFYQGLGYGRDVQTAFELGRNQIDLEGIPELDTPQLLAPKGQPDQLVFVSVSLLAPPQEDLRIEDLSPKEVITEFVQSLLPEDQDSLAELFFQNFSVNSQIPPKLSQVYVKQLIQFQSSDVKIINNTAPVSFLEAFDKFDHV